MLCLDGAHPWGPFSSPHPQDGQGLRAAPSADDEELFLTLVPFPISLAVDSPKPNACEVPMSWVRVITVSHQRKNPPPLSFGMLCLHDLKRASGEGVMGPLETLWCSKLPGTDGESLKGVGVGVPVTLTNQHHVCS